MTVIIASGENDDLSLLPDLRAKPAIPFAGKYQITDFLLINCLYSGIRRTLILT